ncbi:MAG: glycosyltransferase family 4 protein [Candidatus Bathyarchaeota archaeon]|nr:glycosyltransferase family 4 protein [Candidatus Bathyarchaeota archaeon]
MKGNFSVLFVIDTTSHDDCSAVQRFRVLKAGLEKLGVRADLLFLGDYRINSPRILATVNTPLFLEKVRAYDFVHTAGLSLIPMSLNKHLANFKMVCDIHGSISEYELTKKGILEFSGNYQWIAHRIAWEIARHTSDCFITVSDPLREKMLSEGVAKEKTEIIYNGVDTELFRPCQIEHNGVFTVTYAGAYQKWQGIENLVDAIELLKAEKVKFKFLGFQRHNAALKENIKRRLKNKAELFDYQPRVSDKQPESFLQKLWESDIMIIPRYWNPATPLYCNPEYVRRTFGWLPTKFAEFLALGKPVIVTSLDVSANFVEEYNCGFVCDPSPQSLAKAILEAKRTPQNELRKMGENARKVAEEFFDQRVTCKKYYEFITQFLN